jgi:hypothetical protein
MLGIRSSLNPARSGFLHKLKQLSKEVITVTDVVLVNELIYCSYNLVFATRNLHFPIVDELLLPKTIISSFAFKYFSEPEKNLICACEACNDTLEFRKLHPNYNTIKVTTSNEIRISIYNPSNFQDTRSFALSNLHQFTGLCRKYRTPDEVENMLTKIFKNVR